MDGAHTNTSMNLSKHSPQQFFLIKSKNFNHSRKRKNLSTYSLEYQILSPRQNVKNNRILIYFVYLLAMCTFSFVGTTSLSQAYPYQPTSQKMFEPLTNSSSTVWTPKEFLSHETKKLSRPKRSQLYSNNTILHPTISSNSSSLYVELLIVHDHSQFLEYEGKDAVIIDRTLQIVNIMNAFYKELNIFIVLVGVVIWDEKDEFEITDDGDATLAKFLKYRSEKLLPKYHHDTAQLLTRVSFNGSVVGKAVRGPICTLEHSGGVNTDHSQNAAVVAVTLAHELGHNLGMEHDDDTKCECPDDKCIMSAQSTQLHPTHWSSCSKEYLKESRQRGQLVCLENLPEKNIGPICGNGFVEEGEDCDLGENLPYNDVSKSKNKSETCQQGLCSSDLFKQCCNQKTCRFTKNSTCANGSCCDRKTCSVVAISENQVCREKKSECDLEEVCDGRSEYCPTDVYVHNGLECGLDDSPMATFYVPLPDELEEEQPKAKAYCFNGKCASHEAQCNLLWGAKAKVSEIACYKQNIHANISGNCGYDHKTKKYLTCNNEDIYCGMMHCVHNQPGVDLTQIGKTEYGFAPASTLAITHFSYGPQGIKDDSHCHGAIIDLGPKTADPGMVPNGAVCGINKICFNQKCVPVEHIVSPNWCSSDCNGNGICDNLGVCHCNDGSIGSTCYGFFGIGYGITFFFYLLMFLLPVVGILMLVFRHYKPKVKLWWHVQRRKSQLMKQPITKQNSRQTGAMPTMHINFSSSRQSLPQISNNNMNFNKLPPILTEREQEEQNMSNQKRYQVSDDMFEDPWNDTLSRATTIGAPVGFRLEPLKHQKRSASLHTDTATKRLATNQQVRCNKVDSEKLQNEQEDKLLPVRPAPQPPSPSPPLSKD